MSLLLEMIKEIYGGVLLLFEKIKFLWSAELAVEMTLFGKIKGTHARQDF